MRRAAPGPVTIYEVAREAGVSTATVSRVINDRRHVREATRLKVEEAMARLGYVANRQARGLAGGRSRVIGLLVYELGSSYFNQLIRGIDAAADEIGYDLMLYTTHARREREAQHAAELASGPVDGLIIVLAVDIDSYVDRLHRQGVPFVLLDHDSNVPGTTFVTAANRQGARTPSSTSSASAIDASGSSPARLAPAPPASGWPATATRCETPASSSTRRSWSRATSSRSAATMACASNCSRSTAPDGDLHLGRHGRLRRHQGRSAEAGLRVPSDISDRRLRRHPRGLAGDAPR